VEALARVAARRYDLVLMDVEMPELDGYETTRRIRAAESDSNRPRLAVVAMTANALNEDRERCLASGMDDHLGKPVTLEQLATILRRWLPPSAHAGGPPDLRQAG
jgi:CheY-like chemotaxis protein